jgi:cytochrome d ubiquinol oxidase subunit II
MTAMFAQFGLPEIWAGLIAFAVLTYVVLDGFDLGIGILFPFFKHEDERTMAMDTIAPIWDGNETWLVLGGGGLLAVFPLAYGVVLNALYVPIIIMLLALVFRGVAFEFRGKTKNWKVLWDASFFAGSLTATLAQGAILGGLLQGPKIEGRVFAGSVWDWATPFALMTALALVAGYVMLGAAWLALKADGPTAEFARSIGRKALFATVIFIAIASLATPLLNPVYYERWFVWPGLILSGLMPVLVLASAWLYLRDINSGAGLKAYLAGIGIFVISFAGLGLSVAPYIVPHSITIRQAAAPDSSLGFLLVGASVLLPIILAYTAYAYWVFRGKSSIDHHY